MRVDSSNARRISSRLCQTSWLVRGNTSLSDRFPRMRNSEMFKPYL